MNYCDNWQVLKIITEKETFYKLLAGTSGGYLTGNSWMLNSGIEECEEDGDYYLFHGTSGSTYKCHKESCIMRMNIAQVYAQLKENFGDNIELVNGDDVHDWTKFKWKL